MSLTIDGQANSITSSVGGVNIPATVGTLSVGPSGSYMNVTSSGIAATSITATNITSGSVASTNITTTQVLNNSGKPILNSTGSILQVGYTEYTTQFSSATTQTYQIFYSQTITASASNSRYLLIGNTHAYSATSGARCNIGYSVTISGTTTRISGVDGVNGDSWGNECINGVTMNRQAIYTSTASAGTTLTFNFLVASYDAATYIFNYSGYGHKSTFTVMEISS
jgi:hypothetical protein